jgi:hypothetical protein
MADAEILALTAGAAAISEPWGQEHLDAHISGRRNPVQRCLLMGESPAHDNAFTVTFAVVRASKI